MSEEQTENSSRVKPPVRGRPGSPALSDLSLHSDRSKGSLPNFRQGKSGPPVSGRPGSPTLSDLSLQSDRSKGSLPNFRQGESGPPVSGRPGSPTLSDLSLQSDRSKGSLPNFRQGESGPPVSGRPGSPTLSDLSLQSDRSKGSLPNFRQGESGPPVSGRPGSPTLSDLSLQSDRSKGSLPNFRQGESGPPVSGRPGSPTLSDLSLQSDRSKGSLPNFRQGESGPPVSGRPGSPTLSDLSLQSDRSKGSLPNFRQGESGPPVSGRPGSPTLSDLSLRSDPSKGSLPNFRQGESGPPVSGKPGSPTLSDLSLQSDRSKGSPPNFRHEESGPPVSGRPGSPTLSDLSFQSDRSKGSLPNFRQGESGSTSPRTDVDHPNDRGGKYGNLKDWKKLISTLKNRFRRDIPDADEHHRNHNKTELIMKEDKAHIVVESVSEIFEDSKEKNIRTVLTVGEGGIGKSFHVKRFIKEWAKGNQSFFSKLWSRIGGANDDGIVIPLDLSKLNVIKNDKLSFEGLLHYFFQETKKCHISNFEQFKVLLVLDGLDAFELALNFDDEEKVTNVREPVSVNVLLTSLIRGTLLPSAQVWITSRPSTVHQLPDNCVHRRTEIRYKDIKEQLRKDLKSRILSQHENKLREQEPDTELYEIDASETKEDKVLSLDALFPDTKKVKTVLMKGVPGVGKTHQTIRHMVDWAKGRSNKNIDFIVPLHFKELNSKKVQSMKDLLQCSLNPKTITGVVVYDKCKILFVLDGLEQCKLPLSFEENKDLTDVEEQASMDVLLTSLMKGTLLPSALIWIITQPSGAEKIPPEYIQKVTECRETSVRRKKLISTLQKRFKETTTNADKTHPNQTNTEHIMREEKSHETNDEDKTISPGATSVIQVNAVSEIFKDKSGNKLRNVLTTGVAGIGKSFHVDRFIKEWADESVRSWVRNKVMSFWGAGKDEDAVIFPLNLSKLKSSREEKISLFGLLNHFFQETKQIIISKYEKLRVLFVLDGLDAFEPALDFDDEEQVTDVREQASVDVLLTSLIRGTLLPSARVWITSRPSAVHQLPDHCVHRRSEIRHKSDLASKWAVKEQLTRQFTHVAMGGDMQKTSTLLNDIYTDLYIIEGERGEVETQHETKQIEGAKFKPQETSIKYHAIFKPPPGNAKTIRSVLTLGIAGIGKSFATMKYMLDWAEDKSHEDVFFMFPLSFRELNLRKEETYSLEGLIHSFFPAMRKSEIKDYDKYSILIILDGFDECRLKLIFDGSDRLTDVKKETSVKVLLANLIQGNLLPKAQIWITSRPAASNSIPADKVDRVTEVRGFNDEQKEEYFKKRFDDKDLAEKILSHVKNSRTLYIMCHIPIFCWLTSKVLEDFVERKEEGKMPSTLTDLFVYFLLLQCRQANVKYGTGEAKEKREDPETNSCLNPRNRDTVVSLGKLAFEGLQEGDLVFTEETLTENGVDIKKAAVFSGIFTQIKREGPGLNEQKLFCFVHLSIQEFMASLYVFHTFNDRSENLLTEPPSTIVDLPASDFYKTAVDKALSSKNGHWDLFLRFLLGLSLETNQVLLQELLKKTENNKETNETTIRYIKEKIREEKSETDQNFNLFHCLNELNDQTLVDEAKMYLGSETTKFEDFSNSKWSALNFVLLTSGENLDEFELKKYRKSEKMLLGIMPVVKVAKTALLSWCELTEESCHGLKSSVLSSVPYNLTKLDLSHNDLLDAGVKHLAEGLTSLHCKLEVLKLSGCQVTEEGCSLLASALRSNTASLKELDLSYNHPGAKGAAMLSDLVRDPNMSLRKLCLDRCGEHCLQPGITKYEKEKQQTQDDLKCRILIQHESKLREQEPDTELYETDASETKEDKVPSWDALFLDTEKEEVKTVLMKGVPGVGKTHQTIRQMVDWAKGRSNKNIDFIVPLRFLELNSNEVQSMKDLLQRSLYPKKIPGVVVYDKCKILFVLDGLEQCELPLSFEENKDLNNVEEQASMDVLLTNLMKGTLLPTALIWIITQPSGAEKIPPEYIQKVTECRETLVRRKKLISTLKKRFRETITDADLTHPNQTNTEHIMREEKSHETNDEEKTISPGATSVIQVNAVSEIFKDRSGNKLRNVLTTGVAGIGKSFHVDRFVKEWADEDEDAVFFPLHLPELKSRREEKISLFGLLNHFFQETKQIIISNYEKLRVLFVLDGLDAFKPALNFDDEEKVTDVREPASVDVLLSSLIGGTLLPSARIWITSRPSAVHQLPDNCVDRRTEIRNKPDLVSKWAVQSQLKRLFTHVAMGVDMQKTSTPLNDIFTDLYIIEGERGEVETQHETKQIEGAKFKPQETSIKYPAIFKPPPGNAKTIKSVLTTGMAGIGKSFTTMKYMLDWAENKSHKEIFFMFPFSFGDLNLRKEETYSLEGLIHSFFPAMRKSEIEDYDKYSILIVLDGFDDRRLKLIFNGSDRLTDVTKETSVKVLLANLIQGNLLPKAQIWITSQHAASNSIPADKVDRVTEVRGFTDNQTEEYFKKRFDEQDLAEKILSHVKSSRTLYIMCHIPIFCWLTSKVLEDFVERKEEGKMPSTLTDLFVYFLLLQCRQANVKYGTGEAKEKREDPETNSCLNPRNRDTVVSLGKLAFEGLQEGDLVFTEETLTENRVDIKKAAVFSGIFTQIKREGPGLNEQKLFCFVHLSIQEFMASLYVFHIFNDRSENLLTEPPSTVKDLPASDFYKTAVDKALSSKNGHWDLFLRFLLGLSLETNQVLLQELLKKTENNKETNETTIRYIKEKIREEKTETDQNINLFHCLNELNDQTLVDEVQKYLGSETTKFEDFSTSQWSALNFVLLTSGENLDEFELRKYRKSEKVLLGMMPVVKVAKTALLSWCELTEESCHGLKSSVLSSVPYNLTKLDLSHNDLLDAGVKHLAEGLKSLHCKLEVLKLSGCQVTEEGCSLLASALRSNIASLKELDLSYNHPGANGTAMLSALVEDQNMSLTKLCLDYCGEQRLKPGIKKYDGNLKLDENTVSRRLVLSDDKKKVKTVWRVEEKVQRIKSEDRFKRSQVSCEEGQRGLCYWEVEWKGIVGIAVAYRGVGRKWDSKSGFGSNDMSWSLLCSKDGYTAIHGKTSKRITEPFSQKLAVFLDWEAGTLSYYCDKSGELSLIHTFKAQFTEPVYPSFWFKRGSVTLCEVDKTPLRWSQVKAQTHKAKKEKERPKFSKSVVSPAPTPSERK